MTLTTAAVCLRLPPRLVQRVLVACVAAIMLGGCGSPSAGRIAKGAGVAICRQAATAISDPQARRVADQACATAASGNTKQLSQDAKRVARQRCLSAAKRVADPTARQQVKALCPNIK